MKDIYPFNIVLFVSILLIFGWVESKCQVINDNIENRLELKMNERLQSTTTDCTLQWGCLNHALTKKLIQYHNDQWFFFKATDSDKHFINISGQDCRDLRGVQLMLILGKACDPDSYEILDCISLGDQDDVFLKLDNLTPDQEYLVLIDGYLHDFCGFEIEFSDTPRGLPMDEKGIVSMEATSDSDFLMEINWRVPDSIANLIRRYEVYRRFEFDFKSELIHEVEQGFNARGVPLLNYVFEDILPDYGNFYYKIIGIGENDRLLISRITKKYQRIWRADTNSNNSSQENFSDDPKYWLVVDLNYPKACKLNISIYDASSQNLLEKCDFVYNSINTSFRANIKEYKAKGIFSYRIVIVNEGTNEKRSYLQMK